jgi:hypothetical protein
MHDDNKTTRVEETHGEDWAKSGPVQRMNKDTIEHFRESVVGLSLDFTCMSDDKLNTMAAGCWGLWLKGMRTAKRWRGGELVGVEHKKPRTYRLLSTKRNSGGNRVG